MARLPSAPREIRAIGFDDGPFARRAGVHVPLVGVVTSGTRFEGMVCGRTRCDGWGATKAITRMLAPSKYAAQVHVVLLDGIAVGGLNIIDLPKLCTKLGVPTVAVMRKAPDLAAMERAIHRLPQPERRLARLRRAGPIHHRPPFVFQVCGLDPDRTHDALQRLTDRGHVPEPLRLAHLVASALVEGESRGRA